MEQQTLFYTTLKERIMEMDDYGKALVTNYIGHDVAAIPNRDFQSLKTALASMPLEAQKACVGPALLKLIKEGFYWGLDYPPEVRNACIGALIEQCREYPHFIGEVLAPYPLDWAIAVRSNLYGN